MASYVDTIINELLRGNELPRSESRKKKNDDFPTGGMSYVTPFPTGAMSEAPVEQKRDDYNPNGFTWKDGLSRMRAHYIGEAGTRDSDTYKYDKDGKSYIWSGLMPEMPQEYEKAKEPEYTITEIPEAPSDEDTLVPQRPIIDWDKEAPVWNPTPEELGVSYAGGLPAYAIDPNQVRSATNAYAPDQSAPAAMDPQQYMSANGLLPREPLDLSGIQPEAGNNPIPTWARVGMGLADLLRISGTRGGLYPETAVEDPTAYVGATMDQVLKRQKQEQELEKAAKANDLARAKILSQAAMDETDPARKAEFGRAIKRLLPRETQGLDDITAAGMFTGDDKIALEKEKQKGRMSLQALKDLGAMDRLGVKGQQASDLENQKHGNRMEELRAKFSEMGGLERMKAANRLELDAQKHAHSLELQGLKDEAAMARTLAQVNAKLAKSGSVDATEKNWADKALIEPDQGVVEALRMMEENKSAFSPTAAALDTKIGRVTPLISNETLQLRNTVRANLQTVVQESTANLMQLFPKGGSGVINTATEQRLFLPVAEAIASGEYNKILPQIRAFYGNMYDAAQRYAGEKAPISRDEYVRLMTTGMTSDGLTSVPRVSQPAPASIGVGDTVDIGGYKVTRRS